MMSLRPIVIDNMGMILGGNMRYRALQELGFKEIPETWVKRAEELTAEEKRRFIIADNVGFGEWDWDELANNWDVEQLEEWGLDVPNFDQQPSDDELTADEKNKPATMKITFPSPEDLQKCETGITEVLNRLCPDSFYSVSAGEL